MEQQEQETSFNDVDDNNILIRPDNTTHTRVDVNDTPNVRQDVGSIRRAITNDVKKSFKDIFNITIGKKNGPNSTAILDHTRFVFEKSGKVFVEFKGKRIGRVNKNLEPDLFIRKNKGLVDEFRLKLGDARKEYERSPSALVRDLPENVVDDILNSSVEEIDKVIEETATSLSEQDLREFAGILDPKGATAEDRIKALEIQAEYWEKVKLEAKEVADSDDATAEEASRAKSKQTLFDSLERTAKLQADNERLNNNEKPIHDETLEIINDEILTSDLGRLERFKEWAKNNLIGLSAIAITIAGIVTTVVIAGRKAVKQAANATGKLAKALVNIGKKLGPLIAPMLNLMAQAITWGAKGIEFLSKNLWLIAVAFAWFVYDMYKNF